MNGPQLRLGNEDAWVELTRIGEDDWRVRADWCSSLSADFTVYLTADEVSGFAARMLSHLDGPPVPTFSELVTPGRNNPLQLTALHVENRGYAFFALLTPNGDDATCQLSLDIDPLAVAELLALFGELHASSAG